LISRHNDSIHCDRGPALHRVKQLQTELPKLEAEFDYLKIHSVSADEVISEAGQLYTRWPQLPVEEKRSVVESILEKVTIGPGDAIELSLSYLPTSIEPTKNQPNLSVSVLTWMDL
jgi:hypothetical protein